MASPRQLVRFLSAALLLGTLGFTLLRVLYTASWRSGLRILGAGPGLLRTVDASYTEMLVVACRQKDDMNRVTNELADLPVQNVTLYASPSPEGKGGDALSYLSYIIEAYEADTLPDVSIFVHSRNRAWYHPWLLDDDNINPNSARNRNSSSSNARSMERNGGGGQLASILARLDRNFVLQQGYFNLRCDPEPGCPTRLVLGGLEGGSGPPESVDKDISTQARNMRAAWPQLFPGDTETGSSDGRGHTMPPALAQPCCGEFAATREQILATPLADWQRYRDWLLKTDLSDQYAERIWEYMWHVVLTDPSSDIHGIAKTGRLCPTVHSCYCQAYGVCFGSADAWNAWDEQHDQLEELRARYTRTKAADGEEDEDMRDGIRQLEQQISHGLEWAKERGLEPAARNAEPFGVE